MLANEWKKNAIGVMDKIEKTQMDQIKKVAEAMQFRPDAGFILLVADTQTYLLKRCTPVSVAL